LKIKKKKIKNKINKENLYNSNLSNYIKYNTPLIFKINFMDKTIIWEYKYEQTKKTNCFSILLFKLEDKQKYELKLKENEQKFEQKFETQIKEIEQSYKLKLEEIEKKTN